MKRSSLSENVIEAGVCPSESLDEVMSGNILTKHCVYIK